MLGDVFKRFVEKSPISVMVRAALERVLGADRLDDWYDRTAQKQYTRDLLFSTVYDLMSQVFSLRSALPIWLKNRRWGPRWFPFTTNSMG